MATTSTVPANFRPRSWRKDQYLISTDSSLIPTDKFNEALGSEAVYWAKPVPEEAVREMLDNSLSFGLYEVTKKEKSAEESNGATARESTEVNPSDLEFIGLARCLTDYVTFVYITDVYIDPSRQGAGLGRWLMSCIREVTDAMPYLRRTLLFTGDWKRSVPFYEETLGMQVMESKKGADGRSGEGVAVMERKGKGNPRYVEDDV